MDEDAVPMVYPYLTDDSTLRQRLIKNRIYVAMYWSSVLEWTGTKDFEYGVTNILLPLPININQKQVNCVIRSL